MRYVILSLAAVVLYATPAAAQYNYAYVNHSRAYAHFLASDAPVKAYYSSAPGYAWGYDTPYETARYWQTPSVYREVYSDRLGGSVYTVPPVVGGYVAPRVITSGYYGPEYGYSSPGWGSVPPPPMPLPFP